MRINRKSLLLLILALCIVYAILAQTSYFHEAGQRFSLYVLRGEIRTVNENIIIGPYLDFDELKELHKAEALDVVISLLNPDIPYEKYLLSKEREMTERLGINLYSFPMDYLVSVGSTNINVNSEKMR